MAFDSFLNAIVRISDCCSENGQGDVLASAEENGNDNIHLPSAISALSAGVEEVLSWRNVFSYF